ncbi:hypothetical protein OG858_47260 (plasmid) [Streptomyces europaeiscabiei]|uniref:hypothetical protein n=1 Tax=Streptomyces europaeiscabiei TaxID=146819 RepID=UPI002E816410|nr:hypothetical protein [Streptomyces europaeiscabiei]WUD38799.1 hypothetical protein OG858_47260 [Streptomyces europaeiscabiei]
MNSNKDSGHGDRWSSRLARYLREWRVRHGRTVHRQMIRGASYSLGSGAVSLLLIWFEARR